MIVYVSCVVWMLLVNIFSKPVEKIDKLGNQVKKTSKIQIILTLTPIVYFTGMRSRGIADTASYVREFNSFPSGFYEIFNRENYSGYTESLFKAIGIFCKTISTEYHFYFVVISIIIGLFLAGAFYKYSEYYSETIILFMLSGTFSWMLNGVRQFIAVSIIFYAMHFIYEKKRLLFIVFVLLAAGFHTSALLMLPVCFMVGGEAWNMRTIITLIITIVVLISASNILSVLKLFTDTTTYNSYSKTLTSDTGSNILRTFFYAICPILAFIRREQIREKNNLLVNMCINMSLLCTGISLVANFTSGVLVGRLPIYFFMSELILLPWLLNIVYEDMKIPIKVLVYSIFIAFFFLEGNMPYYSNALFNAKKLPAWSIL